MVSTGILIGILLFFGLVAYVLSKTEVPEYLDNQNKPITSQDGLEDVIKEPSTEDIVLENNLVLKKKLLDVDFIEKGAQFDEPINYDLIDKKTLDVKEEIDKPSATEEFQNTEGGRQLTEHIKEIVKLNPDSKKRLTKRSRNTVDKIVKEKK
jgi:hypothetical protein